MAHIRIYCSGCSGPFYEEPNGWDLLSPEIRFEDGRTVLVVDRELRCQNCGRPAFFKPAVPEDADIQERVSS